MFFLLHRGITPPAYGTTSPYGCPPVVDGRSKAGFSFGKGQPRYGEPRLDILAVNGVQRCANRHSYCFWRGIEMSINEIGQEGEMLARSVLIDRFKVDGIFQADWLVNKNGKYYVVEVKHKDMFTPPPFYGHGLNIRQVKSRMMFYRDTGIRCLFLVIDTDGKIFWQWLDVLEQGERFDTKKGVRVYPIDGFVRAGRIAEAG